MRASKKAGLLAAVGYATLMSIPFASAGTPQIFVDTIGVNTHLSYSGTDYVNHPDWIASDLSYIGLHHVRDLAPYSDRAGLSTYNALANTNVHFDLLVGTYRTLTDTMSTLDTFARAHPLSVDSIEGPNEVNNWPVVYNGQTGATGSTQYQQALYSSVKADPSLQSYPVYNLTSWPALAGAADYGNFHSYPKRGNQPYPALSNDLSQESSVMSGKPEVATETGYYTLPQNTSGGGGVDEPTQAKLMLNSIFDSAMLGVKRVYFYQLLDSQADLSGTSIDDHFGLFDYTNRAKPSGIAVHNLVHALGSAATSACLASGGTIAYSIAGLPSTARSLSLQKAPGGICLVIWNEPQIWDYANEQPFQILPTLVTVKLKARVTSISGYDPMVSANPIKMASSTSSLTMALSDHPIVVIVSP